MTLIYLQQIETSNSQHHWQVTTVTLLLLSEDNYMILDGIEGCMRIYCTPASWISFMTSAVYSHTTRNKAIQYYYYYIIWSWLCSEILTILMYTVYVSLQALQLSSAMLTEEVVRIRQTCVGLPTPFSQVLVALTLLPLLNICTLPGCLCIWWFLWILGKS